MLCAKTIQVIVATLGRMARKIEYKEEGNIARAATQDLRKERSRDTERVQPAGSWRNIDGCYQQFICNLHTRKIVSSDLDSAHTQFHEWRGYGFG